MKGKLKSINDELKQLGNKKLLSKAIKQFESAERAGVIMDIHSYGNILNACVRCKNMNKLEEYLHKLTKRTDLKMNVIIFTTIIKGYSDCGMMKQAIEFFFRYYKEYHTLFKLNCRTINTLLRGCKRIGEVKLATNIFDQVITQAQKQEETLNIDPKNKKQIKQSKGIEEEIPLVDMTTFEYLIYLLIQSCDIKYIDLVLQYCQLHGMDVSNNISIQLSLARLYTLIGNRTKAINIIESLRNLNFNVTAESTSVTRFLNHRSNEYELYFQHLQQYWDTVQQQHGNGNDDKEEEEDDKHKLIRLLQYLSKIVCFGFDGRGDLICHDSSVDDGQEKQQTSLAKRLYQVLIEKFGLNHFSAVFKDCNVEKYLGYVEAKYDQLLDPLTDQINISTLFQSIRSLSSTSSKKKHEKKSDKVYLEICAGTGDWVMSQALNQKQQNDQSKKRRLDEMSSSYDINWIAMELRCDRVYDMMTKLFYHDLNNVAILSGDASTIVPNHLPHASIDKMFINFPEPPERTGGIHDSEGDHLLTNKFFHDLYYVLKDPYVDEHSETPMGTITIVSDNLPYIKSIAMEIAAFTRKSLRNWDIHSVGFESILTKSSYESTLEYTTDVTDIGQDLKRIVLWRGVPGPQVGHMVNASSYFDRLWENGNRNDRWFLYLKKIVR